MIFNGGKGRVTSIAFHLHTKIKRFNYFSSHFVDFIRSTVFIFSTITGILLPKNPLQSASDISYRFADLVAKTNKLMKERISSMSSLGLSWKSLRTFLNSMFLTIP